MSPWLKNTDSEPDAILTLTTIGFIVVIFKLLLAGATITWGSDSINFGEIDASIIGAVLTPTLGAYVARRYTDRKFACPHHEDEDECEEEEN